MAAAISTIGLRKGLRLLRRSPLRGKLLAMTFVEVFNTEKERLEAIRLWRTRKSGHTLKNATLKIP